MFDFFNSDPSSLYYELDVLTDKLDKIQEAVEAIALSSSDNPAIENTARYSLDFAADYLGLSARTLKRRAQIGRLVIHYDGRKPFVTGAELLRYVRVTGRKRSPSKR